MSDIEPLAEGEYLFTSESVTEGHPDKVCDQISDAILDAVMAGDPEGRVACETLVNTGMAVVSGEISTDVHLDVPELVRETIRDIGYDHGDYGYNCDHISVLVSLDKQSPDIAQGVDASHETRTGLVDRRRTAAGRGRRPGDDVRLRHRRDRGADADAGPSRPPARRAPRRGAQGRHPRLPRPRRQDPGHGPLRARPPGAGREAADLHPARRRGRLRADDQARPLAARRRPGARGRGRTASTTRRRCARASSSTRPASS